MISRSRCALSSLRSESDCIILVDSTFRTLRVSLKNRFHNHGIVSKKRDFRRCTQNPPVYPNQLRLCHHESFGISSKLDDCFFKSCLKDLHDLLPDTSQNLLWQCSHLDEIAPSARQLSCFFQKPPQAISDQRISLYLAPPLLSTIFRYLGAKLYLAPPLLSTISKTRGG